MMKFPLAWPAGWKRTTVRQRARFQKKSYTTGHKLILSVAQAMERVTTELKRLSVRQTEVIISTNLTLRNDGLPRGEQREPADPGVACYWKRGTDREYKVMAIDQYLRVADNLAAIAATLEAMRAIERHGGAMILERAFVGFECLPAPNNWRDVMGFRADEALDWLTVTRRYRELAKQRHPDVGGSTEAMVQLRWAQDEAWKEVGSS